MSPVFKTSTQQVVRLSVVRTLPHDLLQHISRLLFLLEHEVVVRLPHQALDLLRDLKGLLLSLLQLLLVSVQQRTERR